MSPHTLYVWAKARFVAAELDETSGEYYAVIADATKGGDIVALKEEVLVEALRVIRSRRRSKNSGGF